jgi:hypothetical protein
MLFHQQFTFPQRLPEICLFSKHLISTNTSKKCWPQVLLDWEKNSIRWAIQYTTLASNSQWLLKWIFQGFDFVPGFYTRSPNVAQADLELKVIHRLSNTVMTGVHHHTWLKCF